MGTPAQALKHRGDNKLYKLQVSLGIIIRLSIQTLFQINNWFSVWEVRPDPNCALVNSNPVHCLSVEWLVTSTASELVLRKP